VDELYYSKQSFKYGEASSQRQSYILVLHNQQGDFALLSLNYQHWLSSHGYSLHT